MVVSLRIMNPTRIRSGSKTEKGQVYSRLRQTIQKRCQPGQALSEPELAKLLGVSRTPVRDALARLEKDGLVKIIPRKGAFVSSLGVMDIHELFEAREAIETFAIRRVGGRVDLQALNRLEAMMDRIYANLRPEEAPRERFQALSGVFTELHDLILATLGNGRFKEMLEAIRGTWALGRKVLMTRINDEEVRYSYEEHKQIIEALRRRDPLAAEQAMQMHLEHSRKRFLSAVSP